MSVDVRVHGFCPMGCGETLELDIRSGRIRCTFDTGEDWCPRPLAVQSILSDPETEHIVNLGDDGFSMKHPLRERLDDELLDCLPSRNLSGHPDPGLRGTFRTKDGINFVEI